MSIEATKWAWQVNVSSSSQRLVLLALSDRAGQEGLSYPSIARIQKDTLLNRKTIFKHLNDLEVLGIIVDTGERCGRGTKVYKLRLELCEYPVPKKDNTVHISSPKTDDLDAQPVPKLVSQNYPPVPILPMTSTNFTNDQSQNWDTELYKGTIKELVRENSESSSSESANKKPIQSTRKNQLDLSELPAGISTESAQAFIDHRKMLKAPISQRGLDLSMQEAAKAYQIGLTPQQAIDETILAGWKGIKIEWLANRMATHKRISSNQPINSDSTQWAENLGV